MKMKKTYGLFWGIDVSKEWLDIAIDEKVTRVAQDKTKIKQFIRANSKHGASILATLESTGGYEKQVCHLLHEAGLTVFVAHPNKVVAFAKAKGRLAKTDVIDARLLAQYGQFVEAKEIHALPSLEQEKLSALQSRITQLKEMHHQECCRLGLVQDKSIQKSHEGMLKLIKHQIKRIQAEMLHQIEQHATLKERYHLLCSMPGVGPALALSLLADLPELGHATKKEIAALVGVAPLTHQSGKKIGKALIGHGRSGVRKILYMGALVACRHQAKMRAFYERLVAAGKAKKVAIVAVMRKMLVILNAMMQTKTYFMP